ncbi:hypothetical protein RHGRI_008751 [Rhododendron griersonianum]|uniref:DUF7725 domain-containing protein n=1 Tax=Rhododendron griersonianum TaxID=479676 RepID=A0AAV6L3S0_9ERIC|nr:hypothetical protein RHGRI_008751 [Rhododendron griersonianum]
MKIKLRDPLADATEQHRVLLKPIRLQALNLTKGSSVGRRNWSERRVLIPMEAAAASVAAAARGVSLPMPSSQPSRKEWRIVSEQSVRNLTNEVQQGREPADVDFCSITIDGSSENDVLQHRLHNVARQREELQHMEMELRAQMIARSEMIQMQNSFDAQIKEQSNSNVKLQEQLHEMEQKIREMERKMEEKDRELHAIKLDTEAAWAKEDLLREQSKELQTFRRERDNSEAEKAQHVKQIHDFQEHIQEKERQFLELQEQHRVAQETILYRDEQLRDAQGWIARLQEMDALQSTTNLYSLQAELRERTEQYHQLWIGCQRQFAEMERLHAHTIQQLQLELADARERSGTYPDETHISQTNSKDSSQFGQNNGNQLDVNGSIMPSTNSGGLPTGNSENVSSFVSTGNASTEANHVHGVAISPTSLLGMPTYLPPGQVTALHQFVMHQQGVPHSVPSHVAQSHVGHFQSVPLQHWQNQQASPDGSQVPTQNQYPPSQTDQSLLRSDTNYDYEVSANGQAIHSEYLDIHSSQGMEPDTVIRPTAEEGQVDKSYLVAPQPQQSLQHISSQFHDALRLDTLSQNSETKEKSITTSTNHGLEGQGFTTEQESSANTPLSETSINHVDLSEATMNNPTGGFLSEAFVSSGPKNIPTIGTASEIVLLDERSLLACVVRTIPPGSSGRIRISSTLPNRLGKMLAPLHWHDYKKKYGKLDDFVAGHPELFLIEGDFIQLREGAQEIIAATAAVAKIAAAAKTVSPPYASLLPSVAVTPMAQSHRPKRVPSIDSNSVRSAADNPSQLSVPNQHSNGVSLNAGSISNVRILSKPKDQLDVNGNESRPGQSSMLMAVGNGANHDRSGLGSSVSKGSSHARPSANLVGKQQGRY